MATTRAPMAIGEPGWPPLYVVALELPLSATHSGVAGPSASPHGLTRFGSVRRAWPGRSETRSTCRTVPGAGALPLAARAGVVPAPTAAPSSSDAIAAREA